MSVFSFVVLGRCGFSASLFRDCLFSAGRFLRFRLVGEQISLCVSVERSRVSVAVAIFPFLLYFRIFAFSL